MDVLVAGGSGAMGRRLVPQLLMAGHQVVAMTRSSSNAEWLRRVGAGTRLESPVSELPGGVQPRAEGCAAPGPRLATR